MTIVEPIASLRRVKARAPKMSRTCRHCRSTAPSAAEIAADLNGAQDRAAAAMADTCDDLKPYGELGYLKATIKRAAAELRALAVGRCTCCFVDPVRP